MPWGDCGAAAMTHDGSGATCRTSAAFPPATVVDTLAAGDTFMAATMLALSRGWLLGDAVEMGCRVAGRKCGMRGNRGLKGMFTIEDRLGKNGS